MLAGKSLLLCLRTLLSFLLNVDQIVCFRGDTDPLRKGFLKEAQNFVSETFSSEIDRENSY